MSRSYKKTPKGGVCGSGGQKQFRQQENKAKRHEVKQLLKTGNEVMPHEKEYGNEWDSPRDGKCYWDINYTHSKWCHSYRLRFGDSVKCTCKEDYKEYMRK